MRIDVPPRRPLGIQLTPLIDVVFILLVFFMLTSSFLDWRAFELTLPPADATPDPEVTPIIIDIGNQGALRLADETVAAAALVERVRRLHAHAPERPIVVRANAETPVRITVRTLDRLRAGGFEAVSLAAGVAAGAP